MKRKTHVHVQSKERYSPADKGRSRHFFSFQIKCLHHMHSKKLEIMADNIIEHKK